MSNHLSETQLAAAIVNGLTPEEQQHVSVCSQCSAELEAFQATVGLFRGSYRGVVDAQLAREVCRPTRAPEATHRPLGLWGLAAAMIALVMAVPFLYDNGVLTRVPGESAADTNPDALMKSIQAHLSRTVPGPMEPMLIFVRDRELDSEQRGVQ
jgi:anti-sigma factor RsiW